MPTLMYLPPKGRARRSVLRRGLFGGALLALGGAGFLATRPTKEVPTPKDGLKALSVKEFAVVSALCARIVPPRKGFPPQDELSLAEGCDRVLARADPSAQAEVKQLLGLFENALSNALFGFRRKPFTELSGEEQDSVLREWEHSRLALRRTGFQALRTIVVAAYYGNPKTWSAVGYDGPPQANDPNAPVWRGGGEPRPPGNGVEP